MYVLYLVNGVSSQIEMKGDSPALTFRLGQSVSAV